MRHKRIWVPGFTYCLFKLKLISDISLRKFMSLRHILFGHANVVLCEWLTVNYFNRIFVRFTIVTLTWDEFVSNSIVLPTIRLKSMCWRVVFTLLIWLSNEPTNVGSLLFATNYWTSVLMHGWMTNLRHTTIQRYIPPVPVLSVQLPD